MMLTEDMQNDLIAKLEAQNLTLARTLSLLMAQVSALEFAYDALPEAFVVPGPDGELPRMVIRAPLDDDRVTASELEFLRRL